MTGSETDKVSISGTPSTNEIVSVSYLGLPTLIPSFHGACFVSLKDRGPMQAALLCHWIRECVGRVGQRGYWWFLMSVVLRPPRGDSLICSLQGDEIGRAWGKRCRRWNQSSCLAQALFSLPQLKLLLGSCFKSWNALGVKCWVREKPSYRGHIK